MNYETWNYKISCLETLATDYEFNVCVKLTLVILHKIDFAGVVSVDISLGDNPSLDGHMKAIEVHMIVYIKTHTSLDHTIPHLLSRYWNQLTKNLLFRRLSWIT